MTNGPESAPLRETREPTWDKSLTFAAPDLSKAPGYAVAEGLFRRFLSLGNDPDAARNAVADLCPENPDGSLRFNFGSPYTTYLPEIMRALVKPGADALEAKFTIPTFEPTANAPLSTLISQSISINDGGISCLAVVLTLDSNDRLWAVKVLKPEETPDEAPTTMAEAAAGATTCAMVEAAGMGAYGGCGKFPDDYPDANVRGAYYYLMAPIAFRQEFNPEGNRAISLDLIKDGVKVLQRLHALRLPMSTPRAQCYDGLFPEGREVRGGVLPYDFEQKSPSFGRLVRLCSEAPGKEVTLNQIIDQLPVDANFFPLPGLDVTRQKGKLVGD